jgi:hypothetical protein
MLHDVNGGDPIGNDTRRPAPTLPDNVDGNPADRVRDNGDR